MSDNLEQGREKSPPSAVDIIRGAASYLWKDPSKNPVIKMRSDEVVEFYEQNRSTFASAIQSVFHDFFPLDEFSDEDVPEEAQALFMDAWDNDPSKKQGQVKITKIKAKEAFYYIA